jgi:ABC-2 type transport system permease protein
MNALRIAAVMRRHGYETVRNLDRIADMLLWPLLDVLTWGVFSLYLQRLHTGRWPGPATLILGIIFWGIFRAVQRDIAVGFLAEIWTRNIVGLFASPLTVSEHMLALLIVAVLKLVLPAALALGLAVIIAGTTWVRTALALAPDIAILVLSGAATGILVTGLILRFTSRRSCRRADAALLRVLSAERAAAGAAARRLVPADDTCLREYARGAWGR